MSSNRSSAASLELESASKATPSPEEEIELWARLRSGDQASKERLVSIYRPLARTLAAMLFENRHLRELEFDDFHHFAIVGLLEAMDRYDSEKGALFSTYATHRIRGAILSGVEKLAEKQQQIVARKQLLSERTSSLQGSKAAQKSLDELIASLADIAIGLALGCILEGTGLYRDATDEVGVDTAYRRYELKQLTECMRNLVNTLPDNERMIIKLHYFHGAKFDDIAKGMALSKGRISQLHHSGLSRLRQLYEQQGGVDKLF